MFVVDHSMLRHQQEIQVLNPGEVIYTSALAGVISGFHCGYMK